MYEVLAAALGFRFESYAVACMGALFKALVITVQVCVRRASAAGCSASMQAVTVCTLGSLAFRSWAFHVACDFVVLLAALSNAWWASVLLLPAVLCTDVGITCIITVQVVSEAAEAAAKGILRHCHAPRLVPCVCDVLTGDKNAKLRQACSVLLLQVRHRSMRTSLHTAGHPEL
jgi:hypothetical protein